MASSASSFHREKPGRIARTACDIVVKLSHNLQHIRRNIRSFHAVLPEEGSAPGGGSAPDPGTAALRARKRMLLAGHLSTSRISERRAVMREEQRRRQGRRTKSILTDCGSILGRLACPKYSRSFNRCIAPKARCRRWRWRCPDGCCLCGPAPAPAAGSGAASPPAQWRRPRPASGR